MPAPMARWLAPALLFVSWSVAAATPPAANAADPLNPAANVPPVVYRSSLAVHQRHADQPVGSWQDANALVNRLGGWRAYAREASQPAAALPSPTPPASAPSTRPPAGQGGHAGHRTP